MDGGQRTVWRKVRNELDEDLFKLTTSGLKALIVDLIIEFVPEDEYSQEKLKGIIARKIKQFTRSYFAGGSSTPPCRYGEDDPNI